jgi:hypothetical protein
MAGPGPAVGANDGASSILIERVPDGGIQPQALVDAAGTLHLIYFKGKPGAGDVFYVSRKAGAEQFSDPLRVNSQPGSAIAIGSIRGAQLALGKGGRVHVAWNGSNDAQPRGPSQQSPMLYSRLNDAGDAFEPQRNLIQDAYGLDGGGSVAADQEGNVYVAWHADAGARSEGARRVWVVRSSDEGRTFSREAPADSAANGACGCCGMRAFADSQGKLYLLYRSAREKINRDMYLLISKDHGHTFDGEMLAKWSIAMCPMSSEALVESPKGVLTAWETNGQVFVSRLDRRTGAASQPNAAPGEGGKRKHPALAANQNGQTVLVWTEGTGWERGGSLAWQVYDAAGKPTPIKGRADGIPVWSFAAAYARPDGRFVILY